MGKPIRISDELMKMAAKEGDAMMRSIPKQIEYWSELGRLVEQTGVISMGQIRAFREGQISLDQLTNQERIAASRSVLDDAIMTSDRQALREELMAQSASIYSIEEGSDEIVVNSPAQK